MSDIVDVVNVVKRVRMTVEIHRIADQEPAHGQLCYLLEDEQAYNYSSRPRWWKSTCNCDNGRQVYNNDLWYAIVMYDDYRREVDK